MQFVVKRDILLKSLNFVQGIVEKKKYFTNTFKCSTSIKRKKTFNSCYRSRYNFLR